MRRASLGWSCRAARIFLVVHAYPVRHMPNLFRIDIGSISLKDIQQQMEFLFFPLSKDIHHLGRNFGHGHRNLCSVLAVLMMLVFLIDQVQERCCRVFQTARAAFTSRTSLWATMRAYLIAGDLDGWCTLMHRQRPGKLPRPPPEAA